MFADCIHYIPLLGIAAVLNILFGIYNNIVKGEMSFNVKILFYGVFKAFLFCVSIVGVAYIMDNISIKISDITPKSLLELGVTYYTGKVLIALKVMLFPDGVPEELNLSSEEYDQGTEIDDIDKKEDI